MASFYRYLELLFDSANDLTLLHLQVENKTLKSNCEELTTKNAKLEQVLRSQQTDGENAEITELRFHIEACKNKLRKYATHCQKLEDERAGILHALRSTKIRGIEESDFSNSIVSLCDRVASLEEECASLSKAANRVVSLSVDSEKLTKVNDSLEKEVANSHDRVGQLLRSEGMLKDELSSLQRQLTELQQVAGNGDEIRNLKRENLSLMEELKSVKKQLKRAKAEKHMFHLQDSGDTTLEIDALKSRLAADSGVQNRGTDKMGPKRPTEKDSRKTIAPPATSFTEMMGVPGPAEANEENLPETENSKNRVIRSARKRTNAPSAPSSTKKRAATSSTKKPALLGLGESAEASDENTQNCQQS
jgi:hypothetical protein